MSDKINIALLGNSTTDYIASELKEECRQFRLEASIYNAPFNQYSQEVLNKDSGLYASKPELTLLILEGKLLYPHWFDFSFLQQEDSKKQLEIDNLLHTLTSLVEQIHSNSTTKIIMNNFKIPYHSPLGILDNKRNLGLKHMIEVLNQKLAEFALNKEYLYIFDYHGLSAQYGHTKAANSKMFYIAKSAVSYPFTKLLAREYMRYILPIKSGNRKCLVLDLDNTLWGGVAGEDGIAGIKLDISGTGQSFFDFQQEILNLYKKGILLAVNSKNNREDALNIIENHPHMVLRKKHFSSLQINWRDKAENMKAIAKDLNIGLDSLVFFDDNPVEREFIKTSLPEIKVAEVPRDTSKYTETLREIVDFESLSFTMEDQKRNKMYIENKARQEAFHNSKNLDEFLQSLGSKIIVEYANEFTIPRIAQLTQKTNQFNMTTRRYLAEDIASMVKSEKYIVLSCTVSDRFGDNGIVGVCIIKTENSRADIDTFLLSCRVLGRNIEYAFLSAIISIVRQKGFDVIFSEFVSGEKNKANESFYELAGFSKYTAGGSTTCFILNKEDSVKEFPYINIVIGKEEKNG